MIKLLVVTTYKPSYGPISAWHILPLRYIHPLYTSPPDIPFTFLTLGEIFPSPFYISYRQTGTGGGGVMTTNPGGSKRWSVGVRFDPR